MAWWLSLPVSAALTSLTLDKNGIFGELDQFGILKTPDKHTAEAQLLDAIKASGLTSLSLSGTGMGPVSCGKLAGAFSTALTSLIVSGNTLSGSRNEGSIFILDWQTTSISPA